MGTILSWASSQAGWWLKGVSVWVVADVGRGERLGELVDALARYCPRGGGPGSIDCRGFSFRSDLIESSRARRPVCAAAQLVRELAVVATERGHDAVAERAKTALAEVLDEINWSDPAMWAGNALHGQTMFGWFAAAAAAAVVSPERVRETLSVALHRAPELAPTILRSCSSWVEQRESRRMSEPGVATRTYDDLAAWLPASDLLEALTNSVQAPVASTDEEAARLADELSALVG